jgi:hypothetical protein
MCKSPPPPPPSPFPFSLYAAQCWAWTDAQNSLQRTRLPQLYWESSGILAENSLQLYQEFSDILPFKSWRLCPILLWQPSSFNWTVTVDFIFSWTAIFCNDWANSCKVLWKVGMQSHFHTSGSEMSSRRRMRRRSRKILNAGGFEEGLWNQFSVKI